MADTGFDQNDLSAGSVSQEQSVLTKGLLEEQKQKLSFQQLSFTLAWIFSGLFFISVLAFTWAIMFCPNASLTKAIYSTEYKIASLPDSTQQLTSHIDKPKAAETETKSERTNSSSLFNQFLIMLGLLSAVGTTLAISVIRFSFTNNKETNNDETGSTPISPVASSLSELIKQIADLIKK